MIGKTKILKLPYIVVKPFKFDGKQYVVGDLFEFQPSFARFRNLLKARLIESAKLEDCVFKARYNNFLFKGKTYSRNEEIPFEEIIGNERLLERGFIEQELKSSDKKMIKKEDKKEVASEKVSYSELAKQLNISFKELISRLKEDEEISIFLGENNPHHKATIPDELLLLIEKSDKL